MHISDVPRPARRRTGARVARALLPLGGVRFAILASTALALASCNIGQLGDAKTWQDKSPGTVMFQLDLPSTRTFCDQVSSCGGGPVHVTFTDASGQAIQIYGGFCGTDCARCSPVACPGIACIPGGTGQMVTQVQSIWDGSFYQSSTCGQNISCTSRHFVLPGRYTAHMCATPGTLNQGDAGMPTCTNTGPQQCVDVIFELPGPPSVEAALPDGAQ